MSAAASGRGDASPPSAAATAPVDYAAFLRVQLAAQQRPIQAHQVGNEQIWIKRAGAPHGALRYRTMALLAALLRLPALRPVPNPGGPVAIATEVRRLHQLAARGVRVPEVLAAQADGFAMRHLGRPGAPTPSLANEIDAAARTGDAGKVLALWRQGLETLTQVHGQGTCLSQAFARNMVRCPDGAVACIDFEDDPAAALPLPVCHARDVLCYAHSTAIFLQQVGLLPVARSQWAAWVAQGSPALRAELASSVGRLQWLRHLPASRRLGRDLQRLRAACDLLR